jgi:hypothetical protein
MVAVVPPAWVQLLTTGKVTMQAKEWLGVFVSLKSQLPLRVAMTT